jgi:hypothetical protein
MYLKAVRVGVMVWKIAFHYFLLSLVLSIYRIL